MLLRWIAVGLTLAVLSGSAAAQGAKIGGEARQAALGGLNIQKNLVVNPFCTDDPALLLLNPAYQTHYANYVWWNIGGGTLNNLSTGDNGAGNQNAGVSFSVTRDLVVGVVLSFNQSNINTFNQILIGGNLPLAIPATFPGFIPAVPRGTVDVPINGAQVIPGVTNIWEALAAYRLGRMDLGFGITYGRSNTDATVSAGAASASREASSSMLGFRGGILMDFGAGMTLGGHAALRIDKATDNVKVNPAVPSSGGEYSASGTEIELGAQLKLKVSSRFSFVPYAEFLSVTGTPNEDAAPRNAAGAATPRTDSEDLSIYALAIGAGGEYRISNLYLVGGVSFETLRAKVELSNSAPQSGSTSTLAYTTIPTMNLGAEWWLTNWLAARGGYFRMLGNINTKVENTTSGSGTSSETNLILPFSAIQLDALHYYTYDGVVTLGVGMRFRAFSLDATVSDEALRRGLGLLGSGDNINSFGYMTASYNFE